MEMTFGMRVATTIYLAVAQKLTKNTNRMRRIFVLKVRQSQAKEIIFHEYLKK